MNIGLVFAMKEEFMAALGDLACKEVECKPYVVYELIGESKDKIYAVISGIGKVKSSSATAWLITKFCVDKIINLGTCGATNNVARDGVIVINEVVNKDFDLAIIQGAEFKTPKIVLKKSSKPNVLYTADHFTISSNVSGYFDMEGYAVADVASTFNVKCEIKKVVTDVIDSGTQNNQFNENLNSASGKLNVELRKLLEK